LVELLVVIAIIVTIAGLSTPAIIRGKKNGDRLQTINNAKQIGIAISEFENEYGSYPSDDTREDIEDAEIECPAGDDANAYLAQLIATGFLDAEEVFYAKGVRGTRKGDDIVSSPEEMLAEGENGFGYVMLADGEALSSSSAKSTTPILVAPLKEGGTEPLFDPEPYNDQMVYLRADGAVVKTRIKPDGEAGLAKGKTLFSTGEDTMWGDDQPEVKEPTGLN